MGLAVPLVADIHFSPAAALAATEYVEKVRVNPGNFVDSRKFAVRDYTDAEYQAELERVAARFTPVVRACKERGVAMRIGTNHGSLSDRVMNRFGDSPEGMVESALEFVRICESLGFHDIILSMKASNPKVMIAAYRLLVARMDAEGMDYPLHLGVTEAGNGDDARIKSATGIGSLLLDGLGDTIRVSLAEEPEAEIPVARRIVALCAQRLMEDTQPSARMGPGDPPLPWDPYHFARRGTRPIQLGAMQVGGGATIVVADAIPRRDLAMLPVPPGGHARNQKRPDMAILNLETPADLDRLRDLTWKGQGPATRPLVARGTDPDLLRQARSSAEAICAVIDGRDLARSIVSAQWVIDLAPQVAEAGRGFWLDVVSIQTEHGGAVDGWENAARNLAALAATCAKDGNEMLVSLRATDAAITVRATRLLATLLPQHGHGDLPIILVVPPGDDPMLAGAAALGSLLCDGIGDAVLAPSARLAFDLLQGAGARLTRTDYVACPSCGRTLFDLQSTTERIKAHTAHLKGVKIAIMGCVVNGPGEMADADFGYMGGSPGHVNLYVGKECVERGVPEADADARLIELIRAHGRWVEPGDDDE
jgi:(E)-4-hydroxy-3-methylbut-2-enyl-diphosphate synthase